VSTATTSIEAVLFDWDGTLMDTKDVLLRTYRDASTELYGEPYPTDPETIEALLQLRAQEAFMVVARDDAERATRVKELFAAAYARHQSAAKAFDGVPEALRALVDLGVRVGVATSKARERFEADAGRAGVLDLFAVTVTGEDVSAAKPDPEPVRKAVEALGLRPEQCFYVGDGPNDVLAARGAGTVTVGVEYGFHPVELAAAVPDVMVATPGQIVDEVRRRRD